MNNKTLVLMGLILCSLVFFSIGYTVKEKSDPSQNNAFSMDVKTNDTLFVTKQVVNLVSAGTKTVTAVVTSTEPVNDTTLVTLANGLQFSENTTKINAGQSINATVQIIKPVCALSILNQTQQQIENLTETLTSEPHTFKFIENKACDNGTHALRLINWNLIR